MAMEKKMVNEKALDINNDALEAAMQELIKENNKDNMVKMMDLMRTARFLVPAEFPKNMSREITEKLARGEVLDPKEAPQMYPVIVQNSKGERFVPGFTSRKHIPEGAKYQAILNVRIQEIIRVATDERVKVNGILLNPETTKMILHPQFIDTMKKILENQPATREVKMTKEQFEAFARKNTEWSVIPKSIFSEKKGFMDKLDERREDFIAELYRKPYGDKIPCPYSAKDFDVMVLNINEETCVASIDLPERGAVVQLALSMYIVWNPKTDDMHYFMIEKGQPQQSNVLCSITEDGKHQELQTAPTQGSELVAILELLQEQ